METKNQFIIVFIILRLSGMQQIIIIIISEEHNTYDFVLVVYLQLYRPPLHTNRNLYPIDLDPILECQANCDAVHLTIWNFVFFLSYEMQNIQIKNYSEFWMDFVVFFF